MSAIVPVITLTTDFGGDDAFVAMLKGVLLRSCPQARLLDLHHGCSSQALFDAAFFLRRVYNHYPAGTLHLVGIDDGRPPRRVLLAEAGGQFLLALDSGVLGMVLQQEPQARVFAVPLRAPSSFVARDFMAPLAGRLAGGARLEDLGQPVTDWQHLELPSPCRRGDDVWEGQILHVDPFGNLMTNFGVEQMPGGAVELAGHRIERWADDYASAPEGEPFLLVGAEGWFEISLRGASAAQLWQIRAGVPLLYRPPRP